MRYIFDDRQDKIDIKDELYEKIEDNRINSLQIEN